MKTTTESAALLAAFMMAVLTSVSQNAVAQPVEQAAAAAPVWGIAEVNAFIEANRPRERALTDDPFALPPAAARPEQHIVLQYPVNRRDTELIMGTPTWAYDPTTQQLRLSMYPSSSMLITMQLGSDAGPDGSARPRITKYLLTHHSLRGPTLGITSVVRSSREYSVPVGRSQQSSEYIYETTIAPDEARALVGHVRFVVTAEAAAWAPGKFIICGKSYQRASSANPTGVRDYCFLNSRIINVAFVDSRDGAVLQSWN